MMIGRLLKKSGAAMVWAVCAMMVLALVVAGLLSISMGYYNKALDFSAAQKAQMLAQSGANYAAARMADPNCPAQDWLPLKPRHFENADGSEITTSLPVRVYFDNSVSESIEKWLDSKYGGSYDIDGTDVILSGGSELSVSDKKAIMASNTSDNYAELHFFLEEVVSETAETSDEEYYSSDYGVYVLKITSVAHCGKQTAKCSVAYRGDVFIDIDPKTGRKEITSVWELLGFVES